MPTSNRRKKVIAALDRVRAAERRAQAIIHLAYPIGAEITWEKRGYEQRGVIIRHSDFRSGDSFYVRNHVTGKEYWIDFYWIRGAAA